MLQFTKREFLKIFIFLHLELYQAESKKLLHEVDHLTKIVAEMPENKTYQYFNIINIHAYYNDNIIIAITI